MVKLHKAAPVGTLRGYVYELGGHVRVTVEMRRSRGVFKPAFAWLLPTLWHAWAHALSTKQFMATCEHQDA